MNKLNKTLKYLRQPHWLMAGLLTSITLIVVTQHISAPNKTKQDSTFDVFISNPNYTWTNSQGELRGNITAKQSQYNSKTTKMNLQSPQMTTTDSKQQSWHVSADYGSSLQDKHTIHLWDHVVITTQAKESTGTTVIKTQSLTLLPYQDKAYSNDRVTLVQQNNKIESNGITIDLKSGTIHLLSQARGKYVPE
jgi:lipopolysaccharide export system protein LptC